jgi:homoserine O-acetyltransferase
MREPLHQRIGDLRLTGGGVLKDAVVAYRTLGRWREAKDNVVLVLHGYTSGPDMILPASDAAEGAWDGVIGPGRAIDTDRYYVICPNQLGSCYGSTGPATVDVDTGQPYGPRFPSLAMSDIVASQHALLAALGVRSLVAVAGVSYGGMLAFQWAISHPDMMAGIISVLAAPRSPPADPEGLRDRLAQHPDWHGGDFYGRGDLSNALTAIRMHTQDAYGLDAVLARSEPDSVRRQATMQDSAARWAQAFDANALYVLLKAAAAFDVTADLQHIKAKVLYVLSRSDLVFPPTLAPTVMAQLEAAGVDGTYVEIDSEAGHFASGADPEKWGPALRTFLEGLTRDDRPTSASMGPRRP